MTNSFLKTHRVLKTGEYRMIMRYGLKYHTDHFTLFVNKNDRDHHRLGVVASRKTGNAVVRNRAKRVIREYFRQFSKQLFKNENYDFVFLCKREMGRMHLEKVCESMNQLYEKSFNIFYTRIPKRAIGAIS